MIKPVLSHYHGEPNATYDYMSMKKRYEGTHTKLVALVTWGAGEAARSRKRERREGKQKRLLN